MWKLVAWGALVAGVVRGLLCPDGQLCPQACCERPGGTGYGCCDPARDSDPSLPLALVGGSCEDRAPCPAGFSCLHTPSGGTGCCPYAEAVACGDGRHCCPRGSHCSADGRSCFHLPGAGSPRAVQCPDGQFECPNDSTCCPMPSGSWGCCPLPQATCCEDRVHCCPHSTTCDLAHNRCLGPSGPRPLARKTPAYRRVPRGRGAAGPPAVNVVCPDAHSQCSESTTCCQRPDGHYGCCPLPNAVCCPDRIHCCPQGTRCDLQQGKCLSSEGATSPLLAERPAVFPLLTERPAVPVQEVKCDNEVSCPDSYTCCRLPSGQWGCCPFPEAVCCPDRQHCCPHGYTCNTEMNTCDQGGRALPWSVKTPARRAPRAGDVRCDDHTSCPDGNTCCSLGFGQWGCCPFLEAVCCPDRQHCCPHGYTCNTELNTCDKGGRALPWSVKTPARRDPRSGDVRCDDHTSCPDGNTCCPLGFGQWGCCPSPQAVCCPDHAHCCPNGFTCTSEGQCQRGDRTVPWLKKTPARPARLSQDVHCDTYSGCPSGHTCCRLVSGVWGCCPIPEAVCCPDQVHCCPSGFSCSGQGQCHQGALRVPARVKAPAQRLPGAEDIRCDDRFFCAQGQTCCPSQSGGWACCQLPNAVCCEDRQHCCPWGYSCNVTAQTCDKEGTGPAPAASADRPLLTGPAAPVGDVPCAQGRFCHDDQTCCPDSTGGWACCPYAQGVCCQDRRHCCPPGSRCTKRGLKCGRRALRWDQVLTRGQALPRPLL
ncbi:progranulin isoform X2 [Ornithorhynchus anatinus]|uniref:progranulin isoform X2 n=1 Tax=Ornithorhynchus anatinus TaxID=9258 RepID=UPI0010A90652|nr:progranulin isoform X2 [Ornithorhynchus anatinus]